jgi:Fe-S-cluster containining protein
VLVEKIGSFVNINNGDFTFDGCSGCRANCCNGEMGFAASPLILEDFKAVYEHFPILFGLNDSRLGAYVLLNDGTSHCRYYDNEQNGCTIYENRTPACRLYPVSPYFENIMIDTECPAVKEEGGTVLCRDGKLESEFYTDRLTDFPEKLAATEKYLHTLLTVPENFTPIGAVSGLPLFIHKDVPGDLFLEMHRFSLSQIVHYKGILNEEDLLK